MNCRLLSDRKFKRNRNRTQLADQIDDAMIHRRSLSPAQRSAKNQRDRQRRREHNMEFERLRNVEAKYEVIAPLLEELKAQFMTVRDISSRLAEGSKKLNDAEPYLARTIHELDNILHQNETEEAERIQCLSEWQFEEEEPNLRLVEETRATLLSSVGKEANNEPIDLLSSVGKEANNEPVDLLLSWVGKDVNGQPTAHGIETCHTDIEYSDEFVQDFIEKLDDKEKSRVDFPDFKGLTEEMERSGRFSFPHSLVAIDEMVKKGYGDITAESNQSIPLIRDSYILFCSVIKEMNELRLQQIDLEKMILWRDAINSGLSIGFKANFAIQHLKKIARAHFGSKAHNERELKSMEERISELKAQLYALEKKHNSIVEKQSSKMYRECVCDQEYFQGKRLTAGLFLS